MTPASARKSWTTAAFFACAALALAGAATGVALVLQRGPAPVSDYQPDMVAVIQDDGGILHVQKREVTIAEWNRCHADGACTLKMKPPLGREALTFPATGVSYLDVMEFVAWANAGSGQSYRLPTNAEWAFLAAEVMPEVPDPIFTDPSLTWASAYLTEGQISRRLQPSGSFQSTAAGIDDLDGNVWEWTSECYAGASLDGSVVAPEDCPAFYVQGVHEAVMSYLERDPARGGCAVGTPPAHLGLRLVSDRAIS